MINPARLSMLACAALGLAACLPPCGAAPSRPVPIAARLASCDPGIVGAAVEAALNDPATLREPTVLFDAALAERIAGHKDQAAFLYLAARLRMSRQALVDRGEARQALAAMEATIGPFIMPELLTDPELARRAVRRAVDWDRAHPDPFRDRAIAKGGEFPVKLGEIDAQMAQLPGQAKAGAGRGAMLAEAGQWLAAMRAERCAPSTLDATERDAANDRIQRAAERVAADHPLVRRRAGGPVKWVGASISEMGLAALPRRVTVSVRTAKDTYFNAVVDVRTVVSPDRKLASLDVSLACVSDNGVGDNSWKDVCVDDPSALRP